MSEYQDNVNMQAAEYATKAALDIPFMGLPMLDLMTRVREELRLAWIAGAAPDKDFASTQRNI